MRKRILSGMRPSGKLHLGNMVGALGTWVKLQDEYECFYMVADWHALTTDYPDTSQLQNNIKDMVIDWLACGMDPEKSVIFRQSQVKEHSELFLLLSMVVPLGWLERCPTYKEQLSEIKDRDLSTYGFIGYPVLQASDIIIYKANTVPVGEDQLPHLELTREIVRRFNNFYKYKEKNIFPEPEAYLSTAPRLPGIDGRKMSKSYNNCIYLSEDAKTVENKVKQMFTDPQKIRKNDKGHPDGCVVFAFHKVYSNNFQEIEKDCREGKIGCVDCKMNLGKKINIFLEPIIEKRKEILKDSSVIDIILESGRKKASEIAQKTMGEVRSAIKL